MKTRIIGLACAIATFAFPVFAETYNVTGTVISVQPKYRNVQVPVTVQNCQNVQVPVYGNVQGQGDAVGGALLGMIIGGAVGKGLTGDKDAGAAGAVIGGLIGADRGSKSGTRQVITGYRTERQCTNNTVYENRRELTDYTVTYEVLGIQQSANVATPYNVGDSIPIRVTVGLR